MYEIFEHLLQKNNVTPYKVAKEAGVTQTALSNWKSGKSTPTTKTLQKLADYFDVTIDYLMTGNEKDINLKCDGLEGFQALLADIYGSCEMESVIGEYSECLYFSVGTGKNRYALEENDFDRLYNSVKKTIQQMTNLLLKNEKIVRYECQKAADTPPSFGKTMSIEEHLLPNAAHERTDIVVTDDMCQCDENIMDDEDF